MHIQAILSPVSPDVADVFHSDLSYTVLKGISGNERLQLLFEIAPFLLA